MVSEGPFFRDSKEFLLQKQVWFHEFGGLFCPHVVDMVNAGCDTVDGRNLAPGMCTTM